MLLDFATTKELLEKYQIPLVESQVIRTVEEGISFVNKNGGPVVLKLLSPNVLHKIDKGLVKLNIQDKQDLQKAFSEFAQTAGEILIQKQVNGIELICGMKKDASFGPVLVFGLGGIFVEVLKGLSFQIAPISRKEAVEMIRRVKGFKLLSGYRGQPAVDINKIVAILINLSRLALANSALKEIDFNPVMVNEREILVVDPKIII